MYQFAAVQQPNKARFAVILQKIQETVHPLRVNETKVTWRNDFINDLFALES